MAGTYSTEKIDNVGGIVLQNEVREAGAGAKSSGGPFDPTIMTQREIQSGVGNDVAPGSGSQGPDGSAGNRPGDESQRPAYISEN